MELTKKQLEFWTALIVICIVTAVAVMLVDFGIKAAILEQSTDFRRQYESWLRGQNTTGTAKDRADNNASNDSTISSNVLGNEPTGLEKGSIDNATSVNGKNQTTGRAKPSRQARNREIPSGDK